MFIFEEINNKKILKSDILTETNHFFTTRESVVTPKDLQNLDNLSIKNLNDIANYLDCSIENIIAPVQTHSTNIALAKKGMKYPNTDSLVVEDNNIAILLNFADCTPVIIYDTQNNIGSIAHAGWKGTAGRIVPLTIEFLKKRYKTSPDDIIAIIGPAISGKNYQVDEDVFIKLKSTLNAEYTDYFVYDKINQKYNIDLKTINYHQLTELGVTRIDKCSYCTYDSNNLFFSYRKENGITARHSAILKLI